MIRIINRNRLNIAKYILFAGVFIILIIQFYKPKSIPDNFILEGVVALLGLIYIINSFYSNIVTQENSFPIIEIIKINNNELYIFNNSTIDANNLCLYGYNYHATEFTEILFNEVVPINQKILIKSNFSDHTQIIVGYQNNFTNKPYIRVFQDIDNKFHQITTTDKLKPIFDLIGLYRVPEKYPHNISKKLRYFITKFYDEEFTKYYNKI